MTDGGSPRSGSGDGSGDAVVDARPWSSAGPPLGPELQAEVRRVLADVGRYVTLAPLPDALDYAAADRVVAQAWDVLRDSEPGDRNAPASASALFALHLLERRLADLHRTRASEATEALARVLRRLEAAPCSVPDLVRLIPQFICELGFSRGLISRVEGDVWTPELMYVVDDPEWSQELTEIGQAQPQKLVPGLFETELVRTERSILATNVQQEQWRSHAGLAPASRTRSYVAAPLLSGGEVVGILHAERYGQRRDVDDFDRQLLECFAEAVRIALARAALAAEVESAGVALGAAARAADQAGAAAHRLPPVRLQRQPSEGEQGLVVLTGPGAASARPLPTTLSRRELEVLRLMAAGKANPTIARELFITEGTVKQHVKHVLRKLLVGSRAEAVTRWYQAAGRTAPPEG